VEVIVSLAKGRDTSGKNYNYTLSITKYGSSETHIYPLHLYTNHFDNNFKMKFTLLFISSVMLLQSTICVVTGKAIDKEEGDDPNEYPFVSVVEIYENKEDKNPTVYKLQAALSKNSLCAGDDCSNGQGTQTYPSGSQYVGELKNGKRDGMGKYTWPSVVTSKDGSVASSPTSSYVGRFREGEKHGKGELIWRNGNRYNGDFTDDQIHGYGMKVYADGRTYEGNWKEGKREGFGTLTLADDSKYIGQYRNNQKHDETATAVFINLNGEKWFVKYKNGKLEESARISLGDWVVKQD